MPNHTGYKEFVGFEKRMGMTELTVFTPTYNRATLLTRCYESMIRQTVKEFIWMIIDDGSDDGTEELVAEWMKKPHGFKIEYYWKENGGLHTAYNEAISHITTPLCVCIDSDDWMPDNAVERILEIWQRYGSDKVAGIVGLDYTSDGKIVGDPLPNQETINLIDLLLGKYSIVNGDRTNVVRTDLYQQFAPMKSFPGEKYFNPHYMHLQISIKYDFLVLNENLRFVEYQTEGMSNSIITQYKNSPNSFAEIRLLYLSFPNISIRFIFRQCIHLTASGFLSHNLIECLRRSPYKLLTCFAIIPGLFLSFYIQTHG